MASELQVIKSKHCCGEMGFNGMKGDICPACEAMYHTNPKGIPAPKIRKFETGATRDTDEGKLDFEGFLSPLVLEVYAEYMHSHRKQPDGNLRDSDNWQKGIPTIAYMKSLWRHFFDVWKLHRGLTAKDTLRNALCAIIFNASGYLHEILKQERSIHVDELGPEKESNY